MGLLLHKLSWDTNIMEIYLVDLRKRNTFPHTSFLCLSNSLSENVKKIKCECLGMIIDLM